MNLFTRLDFKISAILVLAMLMSSSYAIWLYSKQSLIFSDKTSDPLLTELASINAKFEGLNDVNPEALVDQFEQLAIEMSNQQTRLYPVLIDSSYEVVSNTMPNQHLVELVRPDLEQGFYAVTVSSRLAKAEVLYIYQHVPSVVINSGSERYLIVTVPALQEVPKGLGSTSVWWQFMLHIDKFALLFSIVVVLAVFIVVRNLKPLRSLETAAEQLADNQIPQQVPPVGSTEVGKLVSAFNHASSQLQYYQQQREQMTSDVAHELRTPITNMLGRIEAFDEGIIQDEKAVIAFVSKQLMSLTKIVEDMQLLSMADSNELVIHRELVDLVEIVSDWAEQFHIDNDITFHSSVSSLTWYLDPNRVTQIFDSLLSNAKKAMPESLHVYLSIQLDNDKLVISFEDNGPGVAAIHLPKLFDRLYRADKSRTEQTGGSGLGLSIVKSLVEAQGGVVKAGASRYGGLAIKMTFEQRGKSK